MKASSLPWLILVPDTDVTELYQLSPQRYQEIMSRVNALSRCIPASFPVDKLNVAAIGNVVEQMHIHVIGRRRNDYCWPQPVWGKTDPLNSPEIEAAVMYRALGDTIEIKTGNPDE